MNKVELITNNIQNLEKIDSITVEEFNEIMSFYMKKIYENRGIRVNKFSFSKQALIELVNKTDITTDDRDEMLFYSIFRQKVGETYMNVLCDSFYKTVAESYNKSFDITDVLNRISKLIYKNDYLLTRKDVKEILFLFQITNVENKNELNIEFYNELKAEFNKQLLKKQSTSIKRFIKSYIARVNIDDLLKYQKYCDNDLIRELIDNKRR